MGGVVVAQSWLKTTRLNLQALRKNSTKKRAKNRCIPGPFATSDNHRASELASLSAQQGSLASTPGPGELTAFLAQ